MRVRATGAPAYTWGAISPSSLPVGLKRSFWRNWAMHEEAESIPCCLAAE